MIENFVDFEVTASQLNALDGTDVTLYTFEANTSYITIPTRLVIKKGAGTAYTVTQPRRSENFARKPILQEEFDPRARAEGDLEVLWTRQEANWRSAQDSEPLFYIPGTLLKATADTGAIIFPNLNGRAFRDVHKALVLRAPLGMTIASGTGSLYGRLFFEEHPWNVG